MLPKKSVYMSLFCLSPSLFGCVKARYAEEPNASLKSAEGLDDRCKTGIEEKELEIAVKNIANQEANSFSRVILAKDPETTPLVWQQTFKQIEQAMTGQSFAFHSLWLPELNEYVKQSRRVEDEKKALIIVASDFRSADFWSNPSSFNDLLDLAKDHVITIGTLLGQTPLEENTVIGRFPRHMVPEPITTLTDNLLFNPTDKKIKYGIDLKETSHFRIPLFWLGGPKVTFASQKNSNLFIEKSLSLYRNNLKDGEDSAPSRAARAKDEANQWEWIQQQSDRLEPDYFDERSFPFDMSQAIKSQKLTSFVEAIESLNGSENGVTFKQLSEVCMNEAGVQSLPAAVHFLVRVGKLAPNIDTSRFEVLKP